MGLHLCHVRVARPLVIGLLSALTGCTPLGLHTTDFERPTVRSGLQEAGIADRQAEFSQRFCANYTRFAKPGAQACERWLSGAIPSAQAPPSAIPHPADRIRSIVIIPGIFGECVSQWVTPFSHDHQYLESLGYKVHVIAVSGRGSSEQNAAIIHRFFDANVIERALVVGYSKGATDFMQAAAQPAAQDWSPRIAAFVSFAGVVNGTPLASRGDNLYAHLADVRTKWCGPSDGGGVESLTYQFATRTAAAFGRTRKAYPSFSVAAVGDPAAINPVLAGTYALMTKLDQRNDGQVLVEDAIVPGSTFLGAFKADHWSIVLPFEDSDAAAMRKFSKNNHFPRRALITSVIEFVSQQLPGVNE